MAAQRAVTERTCVQPARPDFAERARQVHAVAVRRPRSPISFPSSFAFSSLRRPPRSRHSVVLLRTRLLWQSRSTPAAKGAPMSETASLRTDRLEIASCPTGEAKRSASSPLIQKRIQRSSRVHGQPSNPSACRHGRDGIISPANLQDKVKLTFARAPRRRPADLCNAARRRTRRAIHP